MVFELLVCYPSLVYPASASDLTVNVSEHELRIALIEHAIDDQHREEHEFQAEMRSAISRATDILSDVRVQLGRRLLPHS